MKQQKKIFLVSPSPSTFIERDLEALRQAYQVREAVISNNPGENGLKRSLLIAFEILRGVLWADLTYSWFAHNHSYLAVMLANLLGKRNHRRHRGIRGRKSLKSATAPFWIQNLQSG